MNKFWNVPNMLTILRLLLVPALLLCFFLIPGEDHLVAMIIFFVASLTDVLDGLIARKTNQITPYGVVLDPLADKLLKISTLVAFCIVGIIPVWLVSILVFIDVGMIITGMCLYKITIKPISSFCSPLQSDTFFGAFCWSYLYNYGQDALEEIIYNYKTGKPDVIFSNAFPEGYLPAPVSLRDLKNSADQPLNKLEKYRNYICGQVLADSLSLEDDIDGGIPFDLDGMQIQMKVKQK